MLKHSFTEPLSPSNGRELVIQLHVDSWEIECCAPPPAVGERSSWTLGFLSAAGEWPRPEFEQESTWDVEQRDGATVLVRGPVLAEWRDREGAPPPGRATLRGWLTGTVHGTGTDRLAPVTGTVRRLRVVRETYELDPDQTLRPLPDTTTLIGVERSPSWFSSEEDLPTAVGERAAMETGLLIDLAVPLA